MFWFLLMLKYCLPVLFTIRYNRQFFVRFILLMPLNHFLFSMILLVLNHYFQCYNMQKLFCLKLKVSFFHVAFGNLNIGITLGYQFLRHCLKYVRIREDTGQKKPVFWYILCREESIWHAILLLSFISALSQLHLS